MSEPEHDNPTGDRSDDSSESSGPGLIPDADAGETEADSVSRDEDNEGHEEYTKP
jgi:hypothetical protein